MQELALQQSEKRTRLANSRCQLTAKRCAKVTKTTDHFYSLFTVLLKQTLVTIAQTEM
jgi:hypothetical protein